MKTSILLPAHNRGDVIGFSIRSILAQTEPDWELLVVGDGCTDRTAEIVTGFQDPRIRWYDLPKGPGFGYANRNIALREAQGEYIAYASHDDLWLPDHLTTLLGLLEKSGAEWGYSRPLWVEPGGRLLPGDYDLRNPSLLTIFLTQRINGIPASCVMHRHSAFARVGYWDDSQIEHADWEMWARILSTSDCPLAYHDQPTCLHFQAVWRKEANSVSRLAALPALQSQLPTLQLPWPPTEQAIAWLEILSDPAGWSKKIRAVFGEADQLVAASEEALLDAFASASQHFLTLQDYRVQSTNHDPQFLLPPCPFSSCQRVLLRLEITPPAATLFQLFYGTTAQPAYSEKQSIRRELNPGRNILHLTLPSADLKPILRIDPGSLPGDYLIHSLEIRGDSGLE